MRPDFLAVLSALSLLFSTSAYADWRCAISSSPRCAFMEICEKKASADSCQCAWNFSPDGWAALSQSVWLDIIGFALEPSTTEYGEKRYAEAVEKYGEKELRAMTQTLAPNGPQPLMKCNAKLASQPKPADVGSVPVESDQTRICAGQTTPLCSERIVGKWRSSSSSETTTWTFSADGRLATASSDSDRRSMNARWRIVSPDTVVIDLGADGGLLKEMRVELPREVMSIVGITRTGEKAFGGPMIFLPVEDDPSPNRSTLPAGVWTMGAPINGSGEQAPISHDRVRTACANSFVVSQRDGSSQYYFLDHEKGVLLNQMAFTRQGECTPNGVGKETCTFRMPEKTEPLRGSPLYFDDGASLVYRDRVNTDWPTLRFHRCPFSIEAAKPIIERSLPGPWTTGMKYWSDVYSILSGPGDAILGPKAVIADHTRLFYRYVSSD